MCPAANDRESHRASLTRLRPGKIAVLKQLTALKFKLDDSSLNMSRYHQGNRYSLATGAASSTLNAKAWDSDRGCPSALLIHSSGGVSTSHWFIVNLSFSVSPSWPMSAGQLTHSLLSSGVSVCAESWDLTAIFRMQPDVTQAALPPHNL